MAPQGALNHLRLHGLLELLEGAHLDLAHPLAGDAVLLRQLLERGRVVGSNRFTACIMPTLPSLISSPTGRP